MDNKAAEIIIEIIKRLERLRSPRLTLNSTGLGFGVKKYYKKQDVDAVLEFAKSSLSNLQSQ
jgi:hypothetical protein